MTTLTMTRDEALARHRELGEQEHEAHVKLNRARLRLKQATMASQKTRAAAVDRVAALEQEAVAARDRALDQLTERAANSLVQLRLFEVTAALPGWQLVHSELFSELRARLEKAPDSSFQTFSPEKVAQARADVEQLEATAQAIRDELKQLRSVLR